MKKKQNKCRHCKAKVNLFGDCTKKCEDWFKDQSWSGLGYSNPFLKFKKDDEKK